MRFALGLIIVLALLGLHVAALFAVLHPKVDRAYRAYYIDRVSTDWHIQRYPATFEEGIDMARPGWPEFVDYSFGILGAQPFGRWTDTRLGLRSGFVFNRSFSGPVCVLVDAAPTDNMKSRRAVLAFGDLNKEILFGPDDSFRSYAFDFDLPAPTQTLAVVFPKRFPRASYSNPREVGIALKRIRLLSGPCSSLSNSQGHSQ
jgi:hypothetical protein